jgi:1-acyl-sn-glycerol-3-phosphate acyltransferase
VLLVANHSNALVDPIVVTGTAARPIRFLAKAPLFDDARVGWLVKAAGAIPVYRKQDDPTVMGRNRNVFEAVCEALAKGAAIGIFPEGISHSDPSLAEIKTGAARIALGAYEQTGEAFPIIPVGMVPERKQHFRSEMRAVIGQPIAWEDLAGRGTEDRAAVEELTSRIGAGLRGVTLNLERWEDRPLVEAAESIWGLERGEAAGPAQQVNRFEITTRILAAVRRGSFQRWTELVPGSGHPSPPIDALPAPARRSACGHESPFGCPLVCTAPLHAGCACRDRDSPRVRDLLSAEVCHRSPHLEDGAHG